MAYGRRFTATAAGLLLLGTAWAAYATATGWHGGGPAGPPPDEGYTYAGETAVEGSSGAGGEAGLHAEVWLRFPEPAGRTVEYLVVGDHGECRGALHLPRHAMWRPGDHLSSCALPAPGDGPADAAVLVAVPPGTEGGTIELRPAGAEPFTAPLTVLDVPEHRPLGLAAAFGPADGAGRVGRIRTEPPAFPDALLSFPPLRPHNATAETAIRALGDRGDPLAYARIDDLLLTFYVHGHGCGVLLATADGAVVSDVEVPPPLAELPGEPGPSTPGGAPGDGAGDGPPGGPYGQAVGGAPDHGISLDVRCGLRAMVVDYAEDGPDPRRLTDMSGPVGVVWHGESYDFVVASRSLRDELAGAGGEEGR